MKHLCKICNGISLFLKKNIDIVIVISKLHFQSPVTTNIFSLFSWREVSPFPLCALLNLSQDQYPGRIPPREPLGRAGMWEVCEASAVNNIVRFVTHRLGNCERNFVTNTQWSGN